MLGILLDILNRSQINNARNGLTGFLVFDRTWFMQVIEGDAVKVRATFNRIQIDPRHVDLVVTSQVRIGSRAFPDWAMGGTSRTPDTEEVFIRHGLDRDFDPSRLSQASIPALALDLSKRARAKKNAARVSRWSTPSAA